MKKFSIITHQKVSVEKTEKDPEKYNEQELFKFEILKLMDDFLKVQVYGPVTRYAVAGSMRVTGKELFLEALLDFLNDDNSKKEVKLLESLKSKITDWNAIDNAIIEINEQNLIFKNQSLINKEKKKIENIFKLYTDSDIISEKIDKIISNTPNDKFKFRSIAAKQLAETGKYNKTLLLNISEKFNQKEQDLSK